MAKGRLSKDEWDFIERNSDKMTADEIAKHLDRDITPIRTYLQKIGRSKNKTESYLIQAEYDLKSKLYWKELKKQFTEEELEMFLYQWKEIVGQFRRDVMATEELQIMDVIKHEILINQTLRDRKSADESIQRMERDIQQLELIPIETRDRELYLALQRQSASLRAAKEALSREYKDLQAKKSTMFKDLKATRADRVQRLESDKQTFAGLVNKLLQDPEFYEEQGKMMEMMRLATEGCRKELGGYHTFMDSTVDRILLNAETVMQDEGEP